MHRVYRPLFGFVLAVVSASAHVVVVPATSRTGQVQRYTMHVPNEKQVVNASVELIFPAELTVAVVDLLPGWTLSLKKDAQGRILSAVWAGALAPGQAAEFTFTAQNPPQPVVVQWKAVQTFQDGSFIEWTGAEGTKTPASKTTIGQ